MALGVPPYDQLFNPVLEALRKLGGSASNEELDAEVVRTLDLPPAVVELGHLGSTTQTELEYRTAWARTYLKKAGLIENSGRGVWALTQKGREAGKVQGREIVRLGKTSKRKVASVPEQTGAPLSSSAAEAAEQEVEDEFEWRQQVIATVQQMSPAGFERLARRLLLESGFVDVEVTGKTGDGGIDGKGMLRLGGLLSFPVVFQCKRYQGAVDAKTVREFRGAMMGRADRGLILTTSRFTQAAQDEARREGVAPIDLLDGSGLAEKLKELRLGIEVVERTQVQASWFATV